MAFVFNPFTGNLDITGTSSGSAGVTAINGLAGMITLAAGSGITLTPSGNTITIASTSGGGSVTSVSVVSANGLAGTVATATTTPAITLSTTVTGLLKGNGTAISAASAGTDYQAPITLTTTGTSGASTFVSNTLNIPQYQGAGNYITALTGDITASGPGSAAATLATVNSNVGSFTLSNVTVNAKGLVTAASSTATSNLTDTGTDGITITGGTGAVIGSGTAIAQHVADATHNGYLSSTDWSTFNSKGSGTVTSISIASTNGLAGTSSGGATPTITLSTSITGLLKGNGTAISAATPGTDYQAPITLTTTGTSGAATFVSNTLNIPQYQAAGNYITALTGDVTATGPGSATATLATVNSNTGSFGTATQTSTFTVNGKGLITAASNTSIQITESQVTNLTTDLASKLNLSGGTMSGAINMGSHQINFVTDPTSAQDAATKAYVDSVAANGTAKGASVYATTAALATNVYNNGASGVGATLTGVSVGALSIDGNTPSVGQRVLIKNEVTTANNGIYTVTTVGSGIAVYVLTRATDFNSASDIVDGATTFITSGATLSNTTWQLDVSGTVTVGTTSLPFNQISGPGTIVAGTNLTLTGNILSVNNPVVANLTGNASGTAANVTATSNSTLVTLSALSLPTSQLSGTISLTSQVSGILPVTNGGTGTGTAFTAGSIIFAGASGTYSQDNSNIFYDSTNHRIGVGTPTPLAMIHAVNTVSTSPRGILMDQVSADTSGARITERKARGTPSSLAAIVTGDTLASWTASGHDGTNYIDAAKVLVTSTGTISTGIVPTTMALQTANSSGTMTTGIMISAAQVVQVPQLTASLPVQTDASSNLVSAAINLSGSQVTSTLPVANGGTGLNTLTANNVILGNGTSTPTFVAPSTSGNVLTSNGTTWTSAPATGGGTGTVTSVAATVPAFLSVSGSPVTTSGTLAFTLSGTALPVANGGTGATTAATAISNLGAANTADVQVFTSSGTWTKPTVGTPKYIQVIVIGAGGGGGSGAALASGTASSGGAGGGGAGMAMKFFAPSLLGTTETVTIGAAGTAGTSVTSGNGNPGGTGGNVTFGVWLTGRGGSSGGAGSTATSTGGGSITGQLGNAGAGSSGTAGAAGTQAGNTGNVGGGYGGASGGGIGTSPTAFAGGQSLSPSGTNATNIPGGAIGTAGATGLNLGYFPGQPPSAGGSSITGAGGAGGANPGYGAGGSGGGSSLSGSASGAGSVGSSAICVVTTYF